MPTEFSLPSFAKINWYLRILGKRPDGYHELCTLFQTISLHDTLHFAESDVLELTCDDPTVPIDDRNLVIKAAKALHEASGNKPGASIHLEKLIPSPGGLGGGSSNAAVALIGLTRLWQMDIKPALLDRIAACIGSDVPFFLFGGTAIGSGRGEVVEPVEDIMEPGMLVATPDVAVSTAVAYGRIDVSALTNDSLESILRVCRFMARSSDLRYGTLINDLESSVFSAEPEIARVKEKLLNLGAANAAMSGSGASIFAIFDKEETRQAALKALEIESNWRRFAVATVTREEYRKALQMTS
jgi:4-diphosphocytidyl-2-C-methyl-D-erythritol kinase